MNRDERLKVRRQKQNARADERQKVIDEVLRITDTAERMARTIPHNCGELKAISRGASAACEYIRREVLRLKGEQE